MANASCPHHRRFTILGAQSDEDVNVLLAMTGFWPTGIVVRASDMRVQYVGDMGDTLAFVRDESN